MKVISEEAFAVYCASWSGGKDSCLACHLAKKQGMNISRLVHFDRPNNLHGVDPALIRLHADRLKARNLDVCGESGEFRTFVTAGPFFKGKIDITRAEVTARDGFWFLQVLDHQVVR
jgi:diphthamide synthase (EF-2-diphthine--ammonia ligase)